jgi:hypothetical protein
MKNRNPNSQTGENREDESKLSELVKVAVLGAKARRATVLDEAALEHATGGSLLLGRTAGLLLM